MFSGFLYRRLLMKDVKEEALVALWPAKACAYRFQESNAASHEAV